MDPTLFTVCCRTEKTQRCCQTYPKYGKQQNNFGGLHKFFQSHCWFIGKDRFSSWVLTDLSWIMRDLAWKKYYSWQDWKTATVPARPSWDFSDQLKWHMLKDTRLKSKENTEGELQVTNPVWMQRENATASEKSYTKYFWLKEKIQVDSPVRKGKDIWPRPLSVSTSNLNFPEFSLSKRKNQQSLFCVLWSCLKDYSKPF